MLRYKKIISMFLIMLMGLSIGCVCAFAKTDMPTAKKPVDTISRGYKIINGDVYDLSGNLLIKLYNGFTADGYALDPNFTVHYNDNVPSKNNSKDGTLMAKNETEIFRGTAGLPLNKNGNQGIQLGPNFKASSSQPNVYMHYYSGIPSGVNLSVYNVTRGTVTDWVGNVKPGCISSDIHVYNPSRPNDVYHAKASAEGSSGHATVRVAIH